LPAHRHHDPRRDELGHCRADITHPEKAECGALPFLRVPLGNIGDAHCEAAAGHAQPQRRNQHHQVTVGKSQQVSRDRRSQHGQRKDDPPAVLVGPDPQEQADQRSGQDRGADQQAELGIVKAKVLLDLDPDDRKDRPDREADGEGKCAESQRPVLLSGAYGLLKWHGYVPACCNVMAREWTEAGRMLDQIKSARACAKQSVGWLIYKAICLNKDQVCD
jgi:hypothetical protein